MYRVSYLSINILERGDNVFMKKIIFLSGIFFLLVMLSFASIEAQEIKIPFTAESPIILTNPGQSPEYSIVHTLAQRINLPVKIDFHLEAEGLEGYKTLIIIIGGSGKGLGAAGKNFLDEAERAEKLIATAQKKGIIIIGMHLGGETRRGPNSDNMIKLITPKCQYVIVKADGNLDGIFTQICKENEIPLTEIGKSLELTDYLKALFLEQ